MMSENDPGALHDAKGMLLAFRNLDGETAGRAFRVLVEHEEPETLELTVQGGAGLFQWFKFRELGLLVEKRDGEIIEVREKKF
jgi:hypothetical protein